MTITEAQQIQRRLTDKYVVVREGIPELRRFEGLTGSVKTVNMSGRALVQFDGPVDIGWYDIDPACLKIVDQPRPQAPSGHAAKSEPKAQGAPATAPQSAAPKPSAGKSPLDLIRAQSAGGAGSGATASPAGAKPSPLDLIRKSGSAKPGAEAAASPPAAPAPATTQPPAAPAPAQTPSPAPAGMSPLDLIRKSGAAKR